MELDRKFYLWHHGVMGWVWEWEIRNNNKEWRVWESKDKNRSKMNNHQYQSWNFDNTNSWSLKHGEGPKGCQRCWLYNDAYNWRLSSSELMSKGNLAESLGQNREQRWLVKKGQESWGFLQQLSSLLSYLLSSNILLSAMSSSSVHNDGIKGVDTNALLHLGPNVGKPVQR